MGERGNAAREMQRKLYDELGTKQPNAFVDKLTATSEPELVHTLRTEIAQYPEGKALPGWLQKLAYDRGLVNADGSPRDIRAESDAAAKKAATLRANGAEKEARLQDVVALKGIDTEAGRVASDNAAKARTTSESMAKVQDAKVAELAPLIKLHDDAHAITKHPLLEVPEMIAKRGNAAHTEAWQNMMALAKSEDPKFAKRALDAAGKLRRGERGALSVAQRVANEYTRRTTPKVVEKKPVTQDNVEANRAANDTSPTPSKQDAPPDTSITKDQAEHIASDTTSTAAPEVTKKAPVAPGANDPNIVRQERAKLLKLNDDELKNSSLTEGQHNLALIGKGRPEGAPTVTARMEAILEQLKARHIDPAEIKPAETAPPEAEMRVRDELEAKPEQIAAGLAKREADKAAATARRLEGIQKGRLAETSGGDTTTVKTRLGGAGKQKPTLAEVDLNRKVPVGEKDPVQRKAQLDAMLAKQKDTLKTMNPPGVRTAADAAIERLVTSGDDAKGIMGHLAENGSTRFAQKLFGRLQKLGINPEIKFGTLEDIKADDPTFDGDKGTSAAFNKNTNTIWLSDRSNLEQNLLHELVHAATHKLIDQNHPLAAKLQAALEQARAAVKDRNIGDINGLDNLHEFMAEAFSNPAFQHLLESIPSAEKQTLWGRIKNALARAFGLSETHATMLDDVMQHGTELMDAHQGYPARPGSIEDTNNQAVTLAKRADALQDQAYNWLRENGLGKANMTAETQKVVLGFNTMTGIVRAYSHILPTLEHVAQSWRDRDVLKGRINQMHRYAMDGASKLDPASKGWLQQLMGYTRFGIDPMKGWKEHPHLHNEKNAKALEAMVNEANKLYIDSKRANPAIADVYEKLKASNRADYKMMKAVALHNYLLGAHPEINDPAFQAKILRDNPQLGRDPKFNVKIFERSPGDVYQHDATGLHEDPIAADKFWDEHLKSQMEVAKAFNDGLGENLNHVDKTIASKAKSNQDDLSALLNAVNKGLEQIKTAPYFHEGRDGDYFVSGHLNLKDGQLIPEQVARFQKRLEDAGFGHLGISRVGENPTIFMRVENADQAKALHQVFLDEHKSGPNSALNAEQEVKAGLLDRDQMFEKIAPGYLKRLSDMVRTSSAFEPPEGATNDVVKSLAHAKGQVAREMQRQYMNMLSDTNIKKVEATREKVQGWNKDMLKNFDHRAQVSASALSNTVSQHTVTAAFTAMKNDIKKLHAGGDIGKAISAQNVFAELTRREVERSWNTEQSMWDMARSVNHSFYLGASVPYMLEQVSQLGTNLLPELGKHHGFVSSGKSIGKSTGMALKIMRAVASTPHGLDATITPQALAAAKVPPDVAKFIMGCVNRGGVDLNSFTRYMQGDHGDTATTSGKLKRFQKYMNSTALYAETFARVVAMLAAKDLHEKASPQVQAKLGSKENYVDHVVREAMMDWQSWNTSRQISKTGFAGRATPLIMSFSGYQTQMIEKLYTEFHTAFTKGASKEDAAAAKRFLAGHLGAMTLLAGTMGMPAASFLTGAANRLSNLLTGKDDFDYDASYRGFLADMLGKDLGGVVAKGVPHGLGLDLSDLGDQKLIPGTSFVQDRRKLHDSMNDWAAKALGSPFAMAVNFLDGAQDMSNGLILPGLVKMLPHGARAPLDAYMLSQNGFIDKNGTKKPLTADGSDVALHSLGFKGTDEVEYNDKMRTAEGLKETRSTREQYIKQRMLYAHSTGDQSAYASAMHDAQVFGQDHPQHQIMPTMDGTISKLLNEAAVARNLQAPLGFGMREKQIRDTVGKY
jgi:hypothetical protein